MNQAYCSCLRLFRQAMPWPFALALFKAGRSSAARIAMMAITTSNSIRVNPEGRPRQERHNKRAIACAFMSLFPHQPFEPWGVANREFLDSLEARRSHPCSNLRLEVIDLQAIHVFAHHHRAQVFVCKAQMHVRQLQTPHVTGKKTAGGRGA